VILLLFASTTDTKALQVDRYCYALRPMGYGQTAR